MLFPDCFFLYALFIITLGPILTPRRICPKSIGTPLTDKKGDDSTRQNRVYTEFSVKKFCSMEILL